MSVIDVPFPPVDADVEDLLEAWRDAAEDVRLAYTDWFHGGHGNRRERYVVALAASDREAVAADVLARAVETMARCHAV